MKKQREFLIGLYKKRIDQIAFIEYFQNDKYLKKALFVVFKSSKQSFSNLNIFKTLDDVDKEIIDFNNEVFKEGVINESGASSIIRSESFAEHIINKLEDIKIPKLANKILTDFINNSENIDLQVSYIIDDLLKIEGSISRREAESKYRELKRYINNYIIKYLKSTEPNLTKEFFFGKRNELISKLSIESVFDYFEILTESTNKDNEFYLTEKQLLVFIKSTFIDLSPVKQDFNCILYSKKDIRSVFYRFYKINTLLESKQTGIKQKYFDIMNMGFNGFNNADLKEFNKTNVVIMTRDMPN